jgi:hypothetical protein
MSDQVQQWIDKCAIQELIHRYADSVNRADWDETIKVFASDAVWESPLLGMHFDSAAAFVGNLRETGPSSELLVQTATSPVVTLVNDDRARATTTIHEFVRGTTVMDSELGPKGSPINFEDYGIYYDEVSRLGDEWKFTHRVFVPTYLGHDCVTGDVPIGREELRAPS